MSGVLQDASDMLQLIAQGEDQEAAGIASGLTAHLHEQSHGAPGSELDEETLELRELTVLLQDAMYDAIRFGCRGTLAALVAGGIQPQDRRLLLLATQMDDPTSLALVLTVHGPWEDRLRSLDPGIAGEEPGSPPHALAERGVDSFGRGPLHYASAAAIADILCSSLGADMHHARSSAGGPDSGKGGDGASSTVGGGLGLLAPDSMGRSPLHAGVRLGQDGPLPILLRQPPLLARLDARDSVGMTALGYAVVGAAGAAGVLVGGGAGGEGRESGAGQGVLPAADGLERRTIGSMQSVHALLGAGADASGGQGPLAEGAVAVAVGSTALLVDAYWRFGGSSGLNQMPRGGDYATAWLAEVDANLGAVLEMLLHAGADPSARLRVRSSEGAETESLESWGGQPGEQGQGTGEGQIDGSESGQPATVQAGGQGTTEGGSMLRAASSMDLRGGMGGKGAGSAGDEGAEGAEEAERHVVRIKSRLRLGTGRSTLELGVLALGRSGGSAGGGGSRGVALAAAKPPPRRLVPAVDFGLLLESLRSEDPEVVAMARQQRGVEGGLLEASRSMRAVGGLGGSDGGSAGVDDDADASFRDLGGDTRGRAVGDEGGHTSSPEEAVASDEACTVAAVDLVRFLGLRRSLALMERFGATARRMERPLRPSMGDGEEELEALEVPSRVSASESQPVEEEHVTQEVVGEGAEDDSDEAVEAFDEAVDVVQVPLSLKGDGSAGQGKGAGNGALSEGRAGSPGHGDSTRSRGSSWSDREGALPTVAEATGDEDESRERSDFASGDTAEMHSAVAGIGKQYSAVAGIGKQYSAVAGIGKQYSAVAGIGKQSDMRGQGARVGLGVPMSSDASTTDSRGPLTPVGDKKRFPVHKTRLSTPRSFRFASTAAVGSGSGVVGMVGTPAGPMTPGGGATMPPGMGHGRASSKSSGSSGSKDGLPAFGRKLTHVRSFSMGTRRGVALAGAVRLREPAAVQGLLDAGVDPDARDARGVPALVVAARQVQPEMVDLLLQRGASAGLADPGAGSTPLHATASALWGGLADGEVDMVRSVAGASRAARRALQEPAAASSVARLLLEAKARADAPDISGRTALHVALSLPSTAAMAEAARVLGEQELSAEGPGGRAADGAQELLAARVEGVVDAWCDEAAQFAAELRSGGAQLSARDATGYSVLDWVQVGLRLCGDRVRSLELQRRVGSGELKGGGPEGRGSSSGEEEDPAARLLRMSLAAIQEDEEGGGEGARGGMDKAGVDGEDSDDDMIDLESDMSDGSETDEEGQEQESEHGGSRGSGVAAEALELAVARRLLVGLLAIDAVLQAEGADREAEGGQENEAERVVGGNNVDQEKAKVQGYGSEGGSAGPDADGAAPGGESSAAEGGLGGQTTEPAEQEPRSMPDGDSVVDKGDETPAADAGGSQGESDAGLRAAPSASASKDTAAEEGGGGAAVGNIPLEERPAPRGGGLGAAGQGAGAESEARVARQGAGAKDEPTAVVAVGGVSEGTAEENPTGGPGVGEGEDPGVGEGAGTAEQRPDGAEAGAGAGAGAGPGSSAAGAEAQQPTVAGGPAAAQPATGGPPEPRAQEQQEKDGGCCCVVS